MQVTSNWTKKTPYKEGLKLQQQAFDKVKSEGGVYLLGMEHPEVLTLGIRSHKDPALAHYENNFDEVVKIRRGGHLVVHNPGQLVIYPVLSLRENNLSIRDYVCLLTKASKELLQSYKIHCFEKDEPGLFTHTGKIAMFGVGVNQGITQHGICINVDNDLSVFSKIALCDVQGEAVDKVNCYTNQSLETLFSQWCSLFMDKLKESL